jgi:predicted nuclease of predicted toxin-antitoxin system
VRDYGMQRADDTAILQRAARENRILMTMDLGISRDVALSDIPCSGLVIFLLGNATAGQIALAFRQLLARLEENEIAGHITIFEPGRIRRRSLPIGG